MNKLFLLILYLLTYNGISQNGERANTENQIVYREIKGSKILKNILKNHQSIGA